MTLLALLLIPLAAGVLAWPAERLHRQLPRWIAVAALGVDLVLALLVWTRGGDDAEVAFDWIPRFGVRLSLAMDGLSLVLLALTFVLGALAVVASWTQVAERVGFFHANLLWVLAGITGVFLAMDLFLFYVCWEVMLVPMYLLIAVWGSERRLYAAVKFFLFTQAGGLLMLVAILALGFWHHDATGVWSFAYRDLLGTELPLGTATWMLLGFLAAFAVKLPVFPLHTWLPDAHTEAPTAGSVILAGLLLKTGAYGMLRFAVPLFPEAARGLAPWAMALGAVGILYGAVLAFGQTDLKRLVAYTSVSHMGFVLLGVFAWNPLALQGVVIQIIAHGLSTGALFILVGDLYERAHTRDMSRLGGLWRCAPRMGGVGLFLALASLGLPGLANFVAELLVLLGVFQAHPWAAVVSALGLVVATIYALWLIQRVFFGPPGEVGDVRDLGVREMGVMAVVIAGLVWIGVNPQPVLEAVGPTLEVLATLATGMGG